MGNKRYFLIQVICILAILVTIMAQGFTHVVNIKQLFGFPKEENAVPLQFKTIYDGSYQNYLTEHAKRNTGFRELWIRIYNQFAYSGFCKITNNNIQEGEDRELFINMYLNEITGQTLKNKYGSVEEAKIQARKNVEETVVLIDTLRQHGTYFLFVFAPTKTSLYPDKMPKYYRDRIADFCLEEYYIELFKEYDIPHIDLYHYFLSVKDTATYPIYTKTASHWAESAIPIAADTILKTLNAITEFDLPTIQFIDNNVTTDYSDYDWELEKSMNLLLPWPRPALPRPIYTLTDTTGKDRPNLLVVGDSYFDQLMFCCFKDAFKQWDFWQYLMNVYSSRGYYRVPFQNIIDAPNTLENADILLGISTAPMLYNFMSGFPTKAITMYNTKEKDVLEMMETIRINPEWYDAVIKQAEERHLSVEDNLRINAIYVLESRQKKGQSGH